MFNNELLGEISLILTFLNMTYILLIELMSN